MAPLLEWFEVTPLFQKISLVFLCVAIVAIGFYGIVAEPIMSETEEIVRDVQTLESKMQRYQESESEYPHVQEKFLRWESIVAQQEATLGLDVPMNQVLSDMSRIAQETGIILSLWKPGELRVDLSKSVGVRHLQLQIEGGYHQLAHFLEQTQFLNKKLGITAFLMEKAVSDDGRQAIHAVVDFMGYESVTQATAIYSELSDIN